MPILGKEVTDETREIKEPKIIIILKGLDLIEIKCIRDMIRIFKTENIADYESKWKLFVAQLSLASPKIPIFDKTGYISKSNSNYVLVPIEDKKWIDNWLIEVPEDIKEKLKTIVKRHGLSEKFLSESLTKILMEPIPRLKNPEVIASMDKKEWNKFIKSVISPGAEKDHRMLIVFKTHLPRGIRQIYNPHALLLTNLKTGKTKFYELIGIRLDKASAPRMIGYSDAQKSYPGTVDNLYIPLCIEQIESQSAPEILRFLLSFMELGRARSETGAKGFIVKGTCPIVITGNPKGYHSARINTFRSLIDHLTGNLIALGRRFGIIVYGIDYGVVKVEMGQSDVEWQINVQKYRSIEEYILPLIKGIFKNVTVERWLEKPLPDYEKKGKNLLKKINDTGVKEFLTAHFELGYPHIKGGALNCAIIDFIPRIMKIKTTEKEDGLLIVDLLAKAEEYLKKIIAINLESVANMAYLEEDVTGDIFESLPVLWQTLLKTIQNYTKTFGFIHRGEILIDKLQDYLPEDSTYSYISQIRNALDYRTPENISYYNILFEKYWKFRIVLKEKIYQKGIYFIKFIE